MRSILSERNVVVLLFVLVFITFSLAHEDSKKMEQVLHGINSAAISSFDENTGNKLNETPATAAAVQPASYPQ